MPQYRVSSDSTAGSVQLGAAELLHGPSTDGRQTAVDQTVGVVATQAHPYTGAGRGAVHAPEQPPTGLRKVCASERETGPTITAVLERGPLAGRRIEVEVVEGRPPKTIDVPADDGSRYRYCLADWVQTGPSAIYTFLYRV
jgi:hypothetical protein